MKVNVDSIPQPLGPLLKKAFCGLQLNGFRPALEAGRDGLQSR